MIYLTFNLWVTYSHFNSLGNRPLTFTQLVRYSKVNSDLFCVFKHINVGTRRHQMDMHHTNHSIYVSAGMLFSLPIYIISFKVVYISLCWRFSYLIVRWGCRSSVNLVCGRFSVAFCSVAIQVGKYLCQVLVFIFVNGNQMWNFFEKI